MNKEPKFNIKACNDYISSKVEDFQINISTDHFIRNEVDGTILKLSDRESSVVLLKKFVIEAEKEGEKNKHDFLTWLNKRKQHWTGEQYTTITRLNDKIDNSKGKEKKEMQVLHRQFLNFFNYNYDLINMMESDVLNGYSQSTIADRQQLDEAEENKIYLFKNG